MAWINLVPPNWIRRLSGSKPGAAARASPAPGSPRRVLVIDDDGVTRLVLGAALRDAGYDVEDVGDGGEGLTAFRRRPADLVITDLVMPQQGGLETVRELRKADPTVRILVVSGVTGASAEHLRTAVRLGADRVLPKPVNIGELLTMVAGLLAEPPRS
ncbi:MAG: response regulator [Dongiaceae bacterium]